MQIDNETEILDILICLNNFFIKTSVDMCFEENSFVLLHGNSREVRKTSKRFITLGLRHAHVMRHGTN